MPRRLLTIALLAIIVTIMASAQSMTKVLRRELERSEASINSISNATGIQKASLIRFLDGRTSLRLDKADLLAKFFSLELGPRRRRDG